MLKAGTVFEKMLTRRSCFALSLFNLTNALPTPLPPHFFRNTDKMAGEEGESVTWKHAERGKT